MSYKISRYKEQSRIFIRERWCNNTAAAGNSSQVKVRAAWHPLQSQASQKTKKSKGQTVPLGKLAAVQLDTMGFEGWKLSGAGCSETGRKREIWKKKKS